MGGRQKTLERAVTKLDFSDDELIACRVVHAAMSAYAEALGEPALPAWDEAPEWMRQSTLEGVRYRRDNPQATGEAQHIQWMDEKTNAGWTYGPTKDSIAKTHPMIVPYHDLPDGEKRKDHLFGAVVRALTEVV